MDFEWEEAQKSTDTSGETEDELTEAEDDTEG